VCLGEFFRQHGTWGQRLEPPRPLFVRPDFRPPDQIRFAEHSDDPAAIIDHRQRADVVFDQKLDRRGDVRLGFDGHDVADHHVHCLHGILLDPGPFLDRVACPRRARPAKSQNTLTNKT
jgi:hypothetical protein